MTINMRTRNRVRTLLENFNEGKADALDTLHDLAPTLDILASCSENMAMTTFRYLAEIIDKTHEDLAVWIDGQDGYIEDLEAEVRCLTEELACKNTLIQVKIDITKE